MIRRIAITGATGFLGGRAAKILTERGYEVTALGRNRDAGDRLARDGIRFIAVDLADGAALARVFADQDAVVHCAALASPWGPWEDFAAANVDGTRNVIRAMKDSRVQRWVYISTPSIYIDGTSRVGIRESDPLPARGVNAYAESKRLAERIVDAEPSPPVVTLRPQGLFGPGDPQILPRLIRLGERGKLPCIGDGRNLIDLTYVDNVVDAIECALRSGPETFGKKYNVTNGEPVESLPTLLELLRDLGYSVRPVAVPRPVAYALAGVLEAFHRVFLPRREPLLTRYSIGTLALSRTLDISAARRELGYAPRVSLREGLRRVVDAQREGRA